MLHCCSTVVRLGLFVLLGLDKKGVGGLVWLEKDIQSLKIENSERILLLGLELGLEFC